MVSIRIVLLPVLLRHLLVLLVQSKHAWWLSQQVVCQWQFSLVITIVFRPPSTHSHDTQAPTGTLEYFTNYSAGTKLDASQYDLWQNNLSLLLSLVLIRPGTSDGSSCGCAPSLEMIQMVYGLWVSVRTLLLVLMSWNIHEFSRILQQLFHTLWQF